MIALNLLLILNVSECIEVNVISILISTASSLQPEISNVDCTEEIAAVDWINHYDDLNTIWSYCIHHYCNTVDGVVVGDTVSFCT